jgi:cystathionine gamma-synthase
MNKDISNWTKAVHAGKGAPPPKSRPTVAPIYQTSVFSFDTLPGVDDAFSGEPGAFVYSRYGNPSMDALEHTIAALESAEAALVSSSGMAAIATAIMGLCSAGDHVIATQDLYGGTQVLLSRDLARFGIDISFVDMTDLSKVESSIRKNTRMLFVETISNPLMKLVDFKALAAIKAAYGIDLVVDNTFASPLLCQPLAFGADLVMESLTKYINGHSDVTGGALAGKRSIIDRLRPLHINMGGVPSPFDTWLIMRGIKTLPLRMRQHCHNAMELAVFLTAQPRVTRVFYPGLPGHPQHILATEQMSGYGGMLSFVVEGGRYSVDQVIRKLQLVEFVPSLAGVATTLSHPAQTSHRGLTGTERIKLGIDDGLIRVSVGIEDMADICEDFAAALAR